MEIRIEELSEDGMGVARIGRKTVYVPFTAPGDVVLLRSWHRERKRLVAHDYEVLKASEIRVEPGCKHFGFCGGCAFQHIEYKAQLEFKEEKLRKFLGLDVEVLPSPAIYGHRNRIDIAVTTSGIGFRRRGRWWDIVDIEACEVFGPSSKKALEALRALIDELRLEPWNLKEGRGFLRYMVLREGKFTGELMINLVTAEGHLGDVSGYFPFATSLYWSVNRTPSDVSYGEPMRYWGREFIREELDGITYLIHPNSFFQTNSYQAVNLVRKVAEFVDGSKVLDLYSGVGTFGVYLAKKGFEVEGVEINPFAVEMANRNAKINDAQAKFRVGDAAEAFAMSYDTVIVDPPRAGLHPKLVKRLISDGPPTIVYVSCNPKTFAQNLRGLKKVYKLEEIVGLDMFPHTPHVELIGKLVRLGTAP
ncbi:23S rRNA (uracil(1939)-C(5))-methyltransferase RlmD [Pyrococcus yayanosii]|uniref:23S rRNA (Uracil-5-)-methyltransferase n=1 Tax=Pyrococcus yayanosii (strain CH1 / JCM 16557) TaxID=529709 RepID=F8AJ93_PYRYC|nr:23S rRNA (uracil(1939)-C(5))-methyltransferase RlmD [Pyrococcus yayanosii]AEH24535.1 23S rRNA (uracil-5-)-methyltransferase [Pyrococcus yayanosii CH1]